MVGVGVFEPRAADTVFVVRQFFMRSPAEEPALLYALGALLGERELMVTFNGRTFDLPLLRARLAINRSILPAPSRRMPLLHEGSPHLDLLLPARRLWKRRLQSCRLVNLEAQILGLTRSQEDVPGFLIPQLYIDYVRSGRAGEMQRVFYHNQEDIVTTAALAQQMCQAVDTPHAAESGLRGLDWVSLAQNYEQSGRPEEAEHAYLHALECLAQPNDQRLTLQRLAVLYKRMQRWNDAAALWERWLTTVPGADASPYIELSMYHEWKRYDLEQAEMWAAWGLHTIQSAPHWQRLPGQIANLEQRLARIRRKRGA
jgi:tetratricopeptide (TPR) repeat protein